MNVTIVGGGIVGCAAAYELACRGARVRIIDPRGTGQGATRASAGMLVPYVEAQAEAQLRLTVCSLGQYDSFIARIRADAQRRIEYRRCGTLQVARTEPEARQLAEAARRLEAAQVPHTLVFGESARQLEPELAGVSAALLIPDHAYVGVATLMSALDEALSRRGVVVTPASVQRIERNGRGLQIVTSAETSSADAVVIAAGSWSGAISMAPAPPAPVKPIRGQLLHLHFPQPPLSRVVFSTSGYLVPWQDGSVLVGATSEDVGFDESATVAGVRGLLDHARALLPAVDRARFGEVRVGLRPETADELPVIGASSTMRGVYYATGHYRNGVLLAPLTAAMVVDLVLEGRERPELALTRPERFGL